MKTRKNIYFMVSILILMSFITVIVILNQIVGPNMFVEIWEFIKKFFNFSERMVDWKVACILVLLLTLLIFEISWLVNNLRKHKGFSSYLCQIYLPFVIILPLISYHYRNQIGNKLRIEPVQVYTLFAAMILSFLFLILLFNLAQGIYKNKTFTSELADRSDECTDTNRESTVKIIGICEDNPIVEEFVEDVLLENDTKEKTESEESVVDEEPLFELEMEKLKPTIRKATLCKVVKLVIRETSFVEELRQTPMELKYCYNHLKNALMNYAKMHNIVNFYNDNFKYEDKLLVSLEIKDRLLKMRYVLKDGIKNESNVNRIEIKSREDLTKVLKAIENIATENNLIKLKETKSKDYVKVLLDRKV